jgi:hypothetical protein
MARVHDKALNRGRPPAAEGDGLEVSRIEVDVELSRRIEARGRKERPAIRGAAARDDKTTQEKSCRSRDGLSREPGRAPGVSVIASAAQVAAPPRLVLSRIVEQPARGARRLLYEWRLRSRWWLALRRFRGFSCWTRSARQRAQVPVAVERRESCLFRRSTSSSSIASSFLSPSAGALGRRRSTHRAPSLACARPSWRRTFAPAQRRHRRSRACDGRGSFARFSRSASPKRWMALENPGCDTQRPARGHGTITQRSMGPCRRCAYVPLDLPPST